MKKLIKIIFMSSFILSCASVNTMGKNVFNSTKKVINHSEDEDYPYLNGDGESNLIAIEDEDNMMCPNNINYSVGKVSLRSDMKLIVSDDSYYTFVLYASDAYDLRNVNYGSGNSIRLEYSPINIDGSEESYYIQDDAPISATPSELINSGSSDRLKLFTEDFNRTFIEFHIPRTESYCGRVKINSFSFNLNASGSCGKIEGVQLYKSKMDLNKQWVDYNHEPAGITDEAGGPYQDGYKYNISIQYGSQLTVGELKNSLTAYDFGDGKFHEVVLVSDNYTDNRNTLDTELDVVFSSTDSRGNTSTFTFCIYIKDDTPPEIEQINARIELSYTENITEEKLLTFFSFSDNYLNEIESKKITNFNSEIPENYIGEINFNVEARDLSNNLSTFFSSAFIVDDIPPEIEGDDEIVIKAGEAFSDEDILSRYSAIDEIDGETEVTIKSNGIEGNTNSIGLYTCELESRDSSNNSSTKTIFIQVVDSEGPAFYVSESTITQYGTHVISSDEIVKSLVRTNQLPSKNYVYSEFLYGNYPTQEKELKVGTYSEKIAAHADDGSVEYSNVTILVKDEKDQTKSTNYTLFERISNWFSSIWKSLKSFFAKIFTFFN